MSVIKFCALGGLGENGKNLYVLEIDEKIFVLDCGIKYPDMELFGVDKVMPSINYLKQKKEKVQGIFLSHAHEEAIGAVVELLKELDVGVFATHFTLSLVELALEEAGCDVSNYRLYRINDNKDLKFGNVSVTFYNTTHSIPESIGVAFKTYDGTIVYAPDFTFASHKHPKYKTSFKKLSEISSDKVLMLLSESVGTSNISRTNNDYTLNFMVNDVLAHSKRVIFAMYSSELDRIQKIVDLCAARGRKIAIFGRKTQKIIKVAMEVGYLTVPEENLVNLKFMDENNRNDDDNLVVIVTGVRHEPYFGLQRMMLGQDKLIELKKDDNVVIICPPISGTEKIATDCIDMLSRVGVKITNLSKEKLKSSHADSEDLKMLYEILKPKYIVPIIGEFRHQYQQKSIAKELGFNDNQILMLENGDQIVMYDGELDKTIDKVTTGDVLIDGSLVGDINDVVLREREQLSIDGAVFVSASVDLINKKITSLPKLKMKGFILEQNNEEIIDEILDYTNKRLEEFLKTKYLNIEGFRVDLRDGLQYVIRRLTDKMPVVIVSVIDSEQE